MGDVLIFPGARIERHRADAQSLLSDRAYARHNHGADRAFWIGGPRPDDTACCEINPDPDGAA